MFTDPLWMPFSDFYFIFLSGFEQGNFVRSSDLEVGMGCGWASFVLPSHMGCLGCAEPFGELWQWLAGDSGTNGHKSCRFVSDMGLIKNKWTSLNLLTVHGEDGTSKGRETGVCTERICILLLSSRFLFPLVTNLIMFKSINLGWHKSVLLKYFTLSS